MLWVAVLAGIAICVAIAAVWKVVDITRHEKKRRQDEVQSIAERTVREKVETLADDISQKVMDAMKEKTRTKSGLKTRKSGQTNMTGRLSGLSKPLRMLTRTSRI